MSMSNGYARHERTCSRDFVTPTPSKGYRVRLLHCCLHFYHEISYSKTRCLSSSTKITEASLAAGSDANIVDLLEFLQHDAAPYEVRVPPYASFHGGLRRSSAKLSPTAKPLHKVLSPKSGTKAGTKRGRHLTSEDQQVGGTKTKGKATPNQPPNGLTVGEAATTSTSTSNVPVQATDTPQSTSTFIHAITSRTEQETHPKSRSRVPVSMPIVASPAISGRNTDETSASSFTGRNETRGPTGRQSSRRKATPMASTQIVEAVGRYELPLQSGASASTPPSTQAPQERLTSVDLYSPAPSPKQKAVAGAAGRPQRNATPSPSLSAPRKDTERPSASHTSSRDVNDALGNSDQQQAMPSYLAGRRAAVLWQWQHFMARGEGKGERASNEAGVNAPRITTTTTDAPLPAAVVTPSPADNPNQSTTSITPVLRVAGSTDSAPTLPPMRPARLVAVPGLPPPPPRNGLNEATGGPAYIPTTTAKESVSEQAAPRIPKVLLPLTLQGRIQLMEAVLAAAKAAAEAPHPKLSNQPRASPATEARSGAALKPVTAPRVVPIGTAEATAAAGAGAQSRAVDTASSAVEERLHTATATRRSAAQGEAVGPVVLISAPESTGVAGLHSNGASVTKTTSVKAKAVVGNRSREQAGKAAAVRVAEAAATAATETAAVRVTEAAATGVTEATAARVTEAAATGVTEATAARVTEAAATGVTEATAARVTEAAATGVTEATAARVTEAAATGVTEAAAARVTEAAVTGVTEATAVRVTEAAATGGTEAAATGGTEADASVQSLPMGLAAAQELLSKLVRYLPKGREDSAALLGPYVRYQYDTYQKAAAAAAAHPEKLLHPLGLQQLSYILSAYAAAGHRHEPFLQAITEVAAKKMSSARGSRIRSRPTAPSPTSVLTFRSACVLLTALARLRYRAAPLMVALGRWLATALRSGDVTPRAKWKGTWLAAAMWAYASLEQRAMHDTVSPSSNRGGAASVEASSAAPAGDVAAAGAILFSEAAEAIRVDPGWLHLMDCREALWALWSLKVAAALYGTVEGALTDASVRASALLPPVATIASVRKVSYSPQMLVELQLLERATSQFDQLNPGQLAEAYAMAVETGLGADRDMLAALRRCTLERIAAIRPQPLAVMVASLGMMQVKDVTWLSALAAACRNQMINMKAEQIMVVLHSFAVSLRFYYMPLFHAASVVCTLPGFSRLDALVGGDLVRLLAAFAAVGHYEAILLRKMAERILSQGASATAWQRASVLASSARLAYRYNPLLRAVVADAFILQPHMTQAALPPPSTAPSILGFPPSQIVAVVAACGQLQFRPPGLLPAIHAARVMVWPRLDLSQRAVLCWALLVLTGGLAGHLQGGSRGSGGAPVIREGGGGDFVGAAALAQPPEAGDGLAQTQQQRQWRRRRQCHPQLVTALSEYLGALATTDGRLWPATDHHYQLLGACSVIAWQPPDGSGAISARDSQAGGSMAASPSWLLLAPALRGALRHLPAATMRQALAVHHRRRQAALGPWAAQVVEVVRQVLDGVVLADAATAADSAARPWLGLGIHQVLDNTTVSAVLALVQVVRVTPGVFLCSGALGLDLCVELEVELQEARSAGAPLGLCDMPSHRTPSTATAVEGHVGLAHGSKQLGNGRKEGGSRGHADSSLWQQQQQQLRPRRLKLVRIAVELCAFLPPGAGASGLCGGGVVRNSRWLLSGSAALRRRLLAGLGWRVVVLRERTWQGLRSPEQQHRAMEGLLRRAVRQALQEEDTGGEHAAQGSGLDVQDVRSGMVVSVRVAG